MRWLSGFLSLAANASAKQNLAGASCLSQLYLYKGLSRLLRRQRGPLFLMTLTGAEWGGVLLRLLVTLEPLVTYFCTFFVCHGNLMVD